CTQVVGVSMAVTETFRVATRKKVHVVHNGLPELAVDREEGRRRVEALLGGPAEDVVSLVARIDPTKGHRELLAVLPDLLARRPGLHVAFIGAKHFPHLAFADDLKRDLAALGLDEAVAFLGFREDAVELIAGRNGPGHEGALSRSRRRPPYGPLEEALQQSVAKSDMADRTVSRPRQAPLEAP